jgi:HK97 gp10 family phage protein
VSVEVQLDISGHEEFKQAMAKFDTAMQTKVRDQLQEWARQVQQQAQKNVPVRTGYLQSTIYAKIREWVAEIGAEATYALFVEFGTRYMQAQPYLQPAIQEGLPRLERIILEALDMAKAEAGLS